MKQLAPLALAVIVVGSFFGYRYVSPPKQIEAIAVMPFVNKSKNEVVVQKLNHYQK